MWSQIEIQKICASIYFISFNLYIQWIPALSFSGDSIKFVMGVKCF